MTNKPKLIKKKKGQSFNHLAPLEAARSVLWSRLVQRILSHRVTQQPDFNNNE